ncbi:hypothetical protein BKA67DRAFT_255015 [Truncatella angustata]|uniref:Uncharacterized protein n=1 Tax=Truncatella angustata TaxID=152316 RepID=A0A9P8UQA9_9PEZI|nr:uncharacterized protein BKA67DRAFT_255015 [Truncatella angustata]KAH6656089.1 hypothetical protein BKA67DRAFT_255015 [Truncatella angustata]KAH8202370.1 hypothetical protein TruAng_003443 [Truncatella angustata]
MPAIHPALDHSRSNVIFTLGSLAPRYPLQLLIHISIAAAVVSLVVALRLIREDKRNKHSTRLVTDLVDEGVNPSHYLGEGIWEKSRGVSNSVWIGMSANERPPLDRIEADTGLEPLYQRKESLWGVDDLDGAHRGGADVVKSDLALKHFLRARPLPPPPLTRPLVAMNRPSFEGRRSSVALSMTGDLDSSFFSQPNPDYSFSSSSSSSSSASAQPIELPATPRRRSYTRILPLGPPQPVSWLEEDGSVTAFSPSSLPSSSPTLPLAPHESFHVHNIDVKGEIISVLDDTGAGWKRHTRVYGGGVCLACMASEGEGGFYGNSVRPEERR